MSEMHAGALFCSNCGAQNPDRNNFCAKCGMRIVRGPADGNAGVACPNCGHQNDGSSAHCVRCSAGLPKDVTVREIGDCVIVSILKDQIDFENHRDFVNILNKVIKKKVIIDLSAVKWMDSTGVGMLVTYTYRTTRTKQEAKIVGICQKNKEAIRALRVDNVLDIYEDVNAALASWGLPAI